MQSVRSFFGVDAVTQSEETDNGPNEVGRLNEENIESRLESEDDVENVSKPELSDEEKKGGHENADADDKNHGTIAAISTQLLLGDFKDDPSLSLPSSTIRFREHNTSARVYPKENGQFIINEEIINEGDESSQKMISAKWIETSNFNILVLRAIYTLFAAFFTGFLFVLAAELLLFVVSDLTIAAGVLESSDFSAGKALGVLLAFPLYINGLAEALVMSWYFVIDTWNGHLLAHQFGFGDKAVVIVEWCTFFLYLGIPILTMVGSVFARADNWWEITSLTWFICMAISFDIFGTVILWYEFRANFEVIRNRFNNADDRWLCLIKRAILLRQRHTYGGIEQSTYILRGNLGNNSALYKGTHRKSQVLSDVISKGKTFYCRIISWKIWEYAGMFQPVETPEKQYKIEDVQNLRPYLTAHTWSLESIFCQTRNSRFVAVLRGKNALTRCQGHSSVLCAIIGNTIYVLIFAAFLIWLSVGPGEAAIIAVVCLLLFLFPSIRKSYRIYRLSRKIITSFQATMKKNDDDFIMEQNESEGIFQVWENNRVITVTTPFCWVLFAMETFFLFLYPLGAIIAIGNRAIAIIFFLLSFTSAVRNYFNAAIVVEETGRLDLVDGEKNSFYHWQNMSRLSKIIGNITRNPSKLIWARILLFCLLIFVGLGSLTVFGEKVEKMNYYFTYLPEFEYEQQKDVPYPSCSSAGTFTSSDNITHTMRSLADYNFLASLAYVEDNITQAQLDQWFVDDSNDDNGTSFAVLENITELKANIQIEELETNFASPVAYKIITFPSKKEVMLSIRGSQSPFDFIVDMQLWMGALLFQSLRFFMPMGSIFNPLIPNLISALEWLESDSVEKVSYYRETTNVIEKIKFQGGFDRIEATGHSLGGGLAMISGAQTGVAGIGVSAPNAKLSRYALDITLEDLDTKTFNIIPSKDIVPMADDRAQNFQNVRCTANSGYFTKDATACHGTGRRSLCEILYTCGTQNRPALCDCHLEFGYPKPKPKKGYENLDFDEVCAVPKKRWAEINE